LSKLEKVNEIEWKEKQKVW